MSKRVINKAIPVRVDQDKNGRPIQIYRIERVEKSKLMLDIEKGNKTISTVKI